MAEKAISKLKDEMDKNLNNPYIQVVGGYLLQQLESTPDIAEKIMATDKTIGKSLDEMRKVADGKKVGNCAVLTDREGFEVVLKYFGIEASTAPVDTAGTAPVATPKTESDFDVKLEDLL